jgi:hypothetical protein
LAELVPEKPCERNARRLCFEAKHLAADNRRQIETIISHIMPLIQALLQNQTHAKTLYIHVAKNSG